MPDQIIPFIEVPATQRSLTKRKLVHGVGINDAPYVVKSEINKKRNICPYYTSWMGIMDRCYSVLWHKKYPSYIGCTVAFDWHRFMTFRSWMKTQDWVGKALDKDLLKPGNMHYSPKTCIFVSRSINSLLTDNAWRRGPYPQGVSFFRTGKKFRAGFRRYGKPKYLGRFDTANEASLAYKKAKSAHIREVANKQSPVLKAALLRHADLICS